MKSIAVSLPDPGPFGWGVCGRELTAALKELADVIEPRLPAPSEVFTCPLLSAIEGVSLRPLRPQLNSCVRHVGYCFVENNLEVVRYAQAANKVFDVIATGSSWCTEALKNAGVAKAETIIQGIHPDFFEAKDRRPKGAPFTVFTGGKLEFRKGQDIAVRALQMFMGRHPDVLVKTCWFNAWPDTVMSLTQSKYLPRLAEAQSPVDIYDALWEALPVGRVIHYDQTPMAMKDVASLYAATDIGLFPNRCEAGTNLVMMEYMAAGKPVIATYATGHKDVLGEGAPFNLLRNEELLVHSAPGVPAGVWVEPSVTEVFNKLELAYRMRDELAFEGSINQANMRRHTWQHCAERFMELLFPAS